MPNNPLQDLQAGINPFIHTQECYLASEESTCFISQGWLLYLVQDVTMEEKLPNLENFD